MKLSRTAKILSIVLVLIVMAFIIDTIYQAHLSPKAKRGKKNIENIQKVQIGMSKEDFLEIMGKPDSLWKRSIDAFELVDHTAMADSPIEYIYETNQVSEPLVGVVLDTNSRVTYISIPRELENSK